MGHSDQQRAAIFFRRQLVVAALSAAVVLTALLLVGWVVGQGEGDVHATLRPAPDGSRLDAVSPLAESSRSATWAVSAALVAVSAVLVVVVDHMVRVARFAISHDPPQEA